MHEKKRILFSDAIYGLLKRMSNKRQETNRKTKNPKAVLTCVRPHTNVWSGCLSLSFGWTLGETMAATLDIVKNVCLLLLFLLMLTILILILVNATRRCFSRRTCCSDDTAKKAKCVDLYAADAAALATLTQAAPGMTALVDRGVANLETGLYMYQGDTTWTKIGVPETGERYRILRGDTSGKTHTIRNSFLRDTRPPSETQVISAQSHSNLDLCEDTRTLLVLADVERPTIVNVRHAKQPILEQTVQYGRELTIHNTSTVHTLTLQFDNKQAHTIAPRTTQHVFLTAKQVGENASYELASKS